MATQKKATKKTASKSSSSQKKTTASAWRSRRQGAELDLPSGNVALVRNPGIDHFLRTGIIPNSLKGIVLQGIKGKKAEFNPAEVIKDEEDLDRMLQLFDDVLVEVVVEPSVAKVPTDDDGETVPLSERDQSFIYPDEVDMNDKVFIFQFAVGGTRDLERFREEQASGVEDLQSGEGVQLPTK